MTTAIIDPNESSDTTPKRSSKTRRKPWRKRMRNIILSPVHLVRKYVFRKNPRKFRVLKAEHDPSSCLLEAAVRATKHRKLPCYFLFVGLSQSGKSTTISKLFNGERPNIMRDPLAIKVHQNSVAGNDIGIKVIDTPGLLGCNTEERDELIITAIKSFLRRDIPNRIPTVTFITAQLGEDEENKKARIAEFTEMLRELSTIQKYITDECCSNIVLLLTRSQSVEKSYKENIPGITAKYQEAFSKIFPSANCPVPALAIENFRMNIRQNNVKRYHDLVFDGLRDFAEQRKLFILKAMMEWVKEAPRRFSVKFTSTSYPISNFSENEYNRTNPHPHPQGNEQDSGSDTDCETKNHLHCEPYFIVQELTPLKSSKKRKRSKRDKKENNSMTITEGAEVTMTYIPEGSQLVLSNKTVVNIEDCLVGDKLLGIFTSRPSVITGITKKIQDDVILQNTPVGTLYCSVKMSSESDDESQMNDGEKQIYTYRNDSFLAIDASKANIPVKLDGKYLYNIELDAPDGTFITNGFSCFSKMNNNISFS